MNAPHRNTTVARLKRKLHAVGITQQRVAETAGVDKTHVCHVLAGRAKSANVVRMAKRLIAEAKNGGTTTTTTATGRATR